MIGTDAVLSAFMNGSERMCIQPAHTTRSGQGMCVKIICARSAS